MKRGGLLAVLLVTFLAVALGRQQGQQATVTGQVELSSSADHSNAVVWLDPVSGQATVPASSRRGGQLLQKNKTFSPHLLVVQVGSAVDFPNKDPFFHNVFSLFEGKRFDLGLYEAGSTRSVLFNRTGVSYIFCNIHPEMSAIVVALKTPYYGISDTRGLLSIPNVPAGTYDLEVWHERVLPENLDKLKHRVQISPSNSSLGVVRLIVQRSPSELHKNKYGRDYDNPTPNAPVYIK